MKLRQTLCFWAIPSKGLTGFVLKEPHTHNTATPPPLVIANWAPKCIDFCGLFQWCTIAPIAIIAAGQDGYSRGGSQSCTAVSTWNWNWGLRWGWVWGTDFVVMPTLMATPGYKAPMRSHMDLELPVTLDRNCMWNIPTRLAPHNCLGRDATGHWPKSMRPTRRFRRVAWLATTPGHFYSCLCFPGTSVLEMLV